jgi:hypothetical protein
MSYARILAALLLATAACSDADETHNANNAMADMDTTPDPSCPEADNFPAVAADPANSAYPAPSITASCTTDRLVVKSNGIPGYEFVPLTPNALKAQDFTWQITRTPSYKGGEVTVPLLGVIGFSVTGLPFYGPNEAAMPDPYGDPVYNAIVDVCKGHTGGQGDYHLHAVKAACVVADLMAGQPSPIVGYALDGFPVYGPDCCADAACTSLITQQSGWEQTGDPSTYAWDNHAYKGPQDNATGVLDKCNGHTGPKGDYHYHTTETFPYILGCYNGDASGISGDVMEGPAACTAEADCAGKCAADAKGCTCAMTMDGMGCVPTCSTDADCAGGGGQTFTCLQNVCRPQMS